MLFIIFFIFFTTGIAFIGFAGFAQVYLYRKCHRVLQQSSLRWRTQQGLLGIVSVFLAFMYLPHLLHLFYKWPDTRIRHSSYTGFCTLLTAGSGVLAGDGWRAEMNFGDAALVQREKAARHVQKRGVTP